MVLDPNWEKPPGYIQEAADDFRIFLHLVWPEIRMDPHPIQEKVARWIQTSGDHALMMAQRGFGKTYLDAAYVVWQLYRHPDAKIMVLSARENRAIEIVRLAKSLLYTVPMLEWLQPGPEDLNGQKRFDVGCRTVRDDKDPSVHAYGIGSQITGAHVDYIIADDIEIPENSATNEAREKLMEKVREFEDILNPGGKILMIGTPQSITSIYFRLYKDAVYQMIRVPAEYPSLDDDEQALAGLAPWLVDDLESGKAEPGDAVYPERWPKEKLLEVKAKQGASRYALQRQLDPTLSDETKYPLKLANILVCDAGIHKAPEALVWGTGSPRRDILSNGLGKDQFYEPAYTSTVYRDYEHGAMYVDPAGAGADEVGWCIGKMLNGTLFVVAGGGLDGGHSAATLRKLLSEAEKQGVKRIGVEKNFGDGMYGKALAGAAAGMGMRIGLEQIQVSGQKEVRICDILEPAFGSHRVCFDSSVAKDQKLCTQITQLSRDRDCLPHDDRVDALAGLVGMFQDQLFVDQEQQLEDLRQQEFQATMAEFTQGSTGQSIRAPKARKWLRTTSRFRR